MSNIVTSSRVWERILFVRFKAKPACVVHEPLCNRQNFSRGSAKIGFYFSVHRYSIYAHHREDAHQNKTGGRQILTETNFGMSRSVHVSRSSAIT